MEGADSLKENIRWLILIYKTPVEPSTARVRVWRRVRELGGLYIQQAVCLFPDIADLRASVSELSREIMTLGGEAFPFLASTESREGDEDLVERFRAQSNQEYREILEQCKGLLDELTQEAAREKFTFAEIEENEGDLAYIERWVEKARARDFFGADLGEVVGKKLGECKARMHEFEAEVFRRADLEH
ncbi:MAG: hypothetical protein HPY71_09465 [Firmicutes bacterium]|nr:hypothetical protein [Bacillota bacterium]